MEQAAAAVDDVVVADAARAEGRWAHEVAGGGLEDPAAWLAGR